MLDCETIEERSYEFVGGPYDGRSLALTPPPHEHVEVVIHTIGQAVPAEFYVLHSDGRFHYNNAATTAH